MKFNPVRINSHGLDIRIVQCSIWEGGLTLLWVFSPHLNVQN